MTPLLFIENKIAYFNERVLPSFHAVFESRIERWSWSMRLMLMLVLMHALESVEDGRLPCGGKCQFNINM